MDRANYALIKEAFRNTFRFGLPDRFFRLDRLVPDWIPGPLELICDLELVVWHWALKEQRRFASRDVMQSLIYRAISYNHREIIETAVEREPDLLVRAFTTCTSFSTLWKQMRPIEVRATLDAARARKIIGWLNYRLMHRPTDCMSRARWLVCASECPELALEFPQEFIWPRAALTKQSVRAVCAEYGLCPGAPGCRAPRWLLPRWLLQHATAQEAAEVFTEFEAELAEAPRTAPAWMPRAKLRATDKLGYLASSLRYVGSPSIRCPMPAVYVAFQILSVKEVARIFAYERDRCGLFAQYVQVSQSKKVVPNDRLLEETLGLFIRALCEEEVLDARETVTVFRTWCSLCPFVPPQCLCSRVRAVSQGAQDLLIRRLARQARRGRPGALRMAFTSGIRVSATCADALEQMLAKSHNFPGEPTMRLFIKQSGE